MPAITRLPPHMSDERYGYPARLTDPIGRSLKAYYVGTTPDGLLGFVSVDSDALDELALKMGRRGREVYLLIQTPHDIVWLEPPPVGKTPQSIEFKDGAVYIRGRNVRTLLMEAGREFAPYSMEVRYLLGRERCLDIECTYSAPTEIGKIYLVNAARALGIWGLSLFTFNVKPPYEFTVRGIM